MNKYKCRFCENGKNIIIYSCNGKKINNPFLETDNFYLMVSVGAVVQGHILIIPKKHYLSMAIITKSELEELECIIAFARKLLIDLFDKKVIGFEHGTGKNAIVSSASVVHAHFHLLPISEGLLNDVKKDGFDIEPIASIDDLSFGNSSYLLYQDTDERYYKIVNDVYPSQYFRKKVCEKNNDDKWNWKKYEQIENIIETMKVLNNLDINSLYNDFYYEYHLKKAIMDIINVENMNYLRKTSEIQKELGFDSIKIIELIVLLENKFNVTFDDNMLDINNFKTIDDILIILKEEINHESGK